MGLREDLNRTLQDVARGDLGAVIGDAGRIAHGVSGGVIPSFGQQQPGVVSVNPSFNPIPGFHGVAPNVPSGYASPCDGTTVSPPPARSAACCDRYSLSDGFLVDGATGTVWKYQNETNSFEEVPVKREKNKQALIDSLVEAKLSALRGEYEKELMGVADEKERQKQLQAFEQSQLAPLRLAARTLYHS